MSAIDDFEFRKRRKYPVLLISLQTKQNDVINGWTIKLLLDLLFEMKGLYELSRFVVVIY